MHAYSDLVEPCSLVSTGEHVYCSLMGIRPRQTRIVSGNSALLELKSLYVHTCVQNLLVFSAVPAHNRCRWLWPRPVVNPLASPYLFFQVTFLYIRVKQSR